MTTRWESLSRNQRKMDEHSDVKMRELLLDARAILNMISLTVDTNQAKDRARYLCFHIFLHKILRALVFFAFDSHRDQFGVHTHRSDRRYLYAYIILIILYIYTFF